MHLLLVIRATNSNYLSESFLYLQHRQRRSSEVVNFYLVKKEPLQCVFIPIKLPLYICMLSKSIPLPSYCYYFPVLSVKESWLSTYGWLRPTKQIYRQFITIIVLKHRFGRLKSMNPRPNFGSRPTSWETLF